MKNSVQTLCYQLHLWPPFKEGDNKFYSDGMDCFFFYSFIEYCLFLKKISGAIGWGVDIYIDDDFISSYEIS